MSLIRLSYIHFYSLLVYVFWTPYVYFRQTSRSILVWHQLHQYFDRFCVEYHKQSAFLMFETSKRSGLWYNNRFYCNTYWTVLGKGNWIENRFLTHVSDAYGSKYEVRVISFLPSHIISDCTLGTDEINYIYIWFILA